MRGLCGDPCMRSANPLILLDASQMCESRSPERGRVGVGVLAPKMTPTRPPSAVDLPLSGAIMPYLTKAPRCCIVLFRHGRPHYGHDQVYSADDGPAVRKAV